MRIRGYKEVAQGRDMFGCDVSGSESRDHSVVRDWSNITIRVGSRTKRGCGPGRARRGVGCTVARAGDVITAGWAVREPAAGRDAGQSQNTSVLSPIRARVWGDDDYRHIAEFKSAGYILV